MDTAFDAEEYRHRVGVAEAGLDEGEPQVRNLRFFLLFAQGQLAEVADGLQGPLLRLEDLPSWRIKVGLSALVLANRSWISRRFEV